jgi:hypothetical protein
VSLFGDVGGEIASFVSAQCHVRHFRMRLKQEKGELLGIEIGSFRY